jgi:hypothetical protein
MKSLLVHDGTEIPNVLFESSSPGNVRDKIVSTITGATNLRRSCDSDEL